MRALWAPWRVEYVTKAAESRGCIFCERPARQRDEENLIVWRGEGCFVILNRFPYNNGHLMVAPYRHVARLDELADGEILELWRLVSVGISVIEEEMNAEGFNVGINQGKAAGAGVEGHLHVHVVPRWEGDTNFMPVLAETKVIPEHLAVTWRRLREGFEKILGGGGK